MSDTPQRKRRVFGRQSDEQVEQPPTPPSGNLEEERTLIMGPGQEEPDEVTRLDALIPPSGGQGPDMEDIPTMIQASDDLLSPPPPPPPPPAHATQRDSGSSARLPSPPPPRAATPSSPASPKPSIRINDSRPDSSAQQFDSSASSTHISTSPKRVPTLKGYTLIERLGAGTFGSVWRARHLRTNAEMAVKLFDRSIGADWDYLKREIETLLTVGKHPNVVTLHDADFFQEPPFYSMELMTTSLDSALRAHRKAVLAAAEPTDLEDHQWIPWPDLEQALNWFEQMARGLSYVHGKAFIHCDMKPANVLLDDTGAVRIVDFGQALLKGRDSVSLGTLFFMPPEQTEIEDKGKFHPDVRWDIYGLGATIYALLAGRPPRSGKAQLRSISTAGTVKEKLNVYRVQMASTPLVPLTRIHPRISPEFASIVEKCLEINPEKRYGTMTEILDDIDRMRRNLPMISYQPWSKKYLAKKFVRRNALWLIPVGALLSTVVISQFYTIQQYQKQRLMVVTMMNRDGEEITQQGTSATSTIEALDEARINAFLEAMNRARAFIERGQTAEAQRALDTVEATYQSWDWGRLRFLALRHTGGGPPGPQLGVETIPSLPKPDGFVRPSLNGFLLAVNWPYGKGEVFNSQTGIADPNYLYRGENFRSIAIGSDNKTVAGLMANGEIYVRRGHDFETWHRIGRHDTATAVTITPDLKRVVTVDGGGTVVVWILRTGREVMRFPTPARGTIFAEFSSSGNKLVLYDSSGGATLLQSQMRDVAR